MIDESGKLFRQDVSNYKTSNLAHELKPVKAVTLDTKRISSPAVFGIAEGCLASFPYLSQKYLHIRTKLRELPVVDDNTHVADTTEKIERFKKA